MADLQATGVHGSTAAVRDALRDLTAVDYAKDADAAQAAVSVLASFVKGARDAFLGIEPDVTAAVPLLKLLQQDAQEAAASAATAASAVTGDSKRGPSGAPASAAVVTSSLSSASAPEAAEALAALRAERQALHAELQQRFRLPPNEQQALSSIVDKAFDAACAALVADHKALCALEQENTRVINSRGDLPADAAAEYESKRKAYEGLHRAVSSLAESLGRPLPELKEDAFVTRVADGGATADGGGGAAGASEDGNDDGGQPLFDDPETRAFYESLPDLPSLVPAVLLQQGGGGAGGGGDDPQAGGRKRASAAGEDATPPAAADGAAGGESGRGGGNSSSSSAPHSAKGSAASLTALAESGGGAAATSSAAQAVAAAAPAEPPASEQLSVILAKLPSCVTRDLCDELSVAFCYCNSRGNRKRLVRALLDVPRASLQLLPYYARIAATLSAVFPDVAAAIVAYLEDEFKALLSKKDATNLTLEPRVRNMRYLGELAKFRLVPFGLLFSQLKQLLDDFAHHNIDAACALVDAAGRYAAWERQRSTYWST